MIGAAQRRDAAPADLSVHVRDLSEAAVALAWKDHQSAGHVGTAFQSWEWFSALADSPLLARDVEVLCVEDPGGANVGLLALGRTTTGLLRTLGFAGWDYTTPDHVAVIAAPADQHACAAAIAHHLRGRDDWDLLDLDGLTGTSPLAAALAEALRRPGFVELTPEEVVCRYLTLDPAKGMANVPSRHTRKQARKDLRCAEAGGGGVDIVTDSAGVDAVFDDLVELHRERFPDSPVFATPEREHFQRVAAKRLVASGLARVYRLRVGDRVVGISYILTFGGAGAGYLGGRDDRAGPLHSPGRTLRSVVIEDLAGSGFHEYDGLRGSHEYKYSITDSEHTDLRLRYLRTGSRAAAWVAAKATRRAAVHLRHLVAPREEAAG